MSNSWAGTDRTTVVNTPLGLAIDAGAEEIVVSTMLKVVSDGALM